MGNKPETNRRKTLMVDQAFQHHLIMKFFMMVTAGSVLMGAIVYFFCSQTVTTVFRDSHLKIMTTADFILPGLLVGIAAVIAVVGVATVFMAVYASHRIAGPVYRMRQDLANFRSGDLKQVFCVRNKDEMKALAAELEEMTRSVQKSVAVLKAEAAGLESIGGELPPKARGHLAVMKKILDSYRA
jgi:methyl-accepting chemotaxis protein